MNLHNSLRQFGSTLKQHAPTILTAVGVAGVLYTTYTAVRISVRVGKMIGLEDEERELNDEPRMDAKELVQRYWVEFIPVYLSCGATIAAVISANTISSKRQAALIGAYSLSETAFRQYREKVAEQIGENKEQKVRDEVVRDQLEHSDGNEIVILGSGNVHCFDTLTGRHFESNMEKLRKAENDLNRKLINEMYASQNDFYDLIGLPQVDIGEELGWNNNRPLELVFTSVLADDKPVLAMGYREQPIPNYHRIW